MPSQWWTYENEETVRKRKAQQFERDAKAQSGPNPPTPPPPTPKGPATGPGAASNFQKYAKDALLGVQQVAGGVADTLSQWATPRPNFQTVMTPTEPKARGFVPPNGPGEGYGRPLPPLEMPLAAPDQREQIREMIDPEGEGTARALVDRALRAYGPAIAAGQELRRGLEGKPLQYSPEQRRELLSQTAMIAAFADQPSTTGRTPRMPKVPGGEPGPKGEAALDEAAFVKKKTGYPLKEVLSDADLDALRRARAAIESDKFSRPLVSETSLSPQEVKRLAGQGLIELSGSGRKATMATTVKGFIRLDQMNALAEYRSAPKGDALPTTPSEGAGVPPTAPESRMAAVRRQEAEQTTREVEAYTQGQTEAATRRTTHEQEVQVTAASAANMPYEQLVDDENTARALMEWYFERVGNRGMASRMRQGDTVPRVELSKAQRLAKEQLGAQPTQAPVPPTATGPEAAAAFNQQADQQLTAMRQGGKAPPTEAAAVPVEPDTDLTPPVRSTGELPAADAGPSPASAMQAAPILVTRRYQAREGIRTDFGLQVGDDVYLVVGTKADGSLQIDWEAVGDSQKFSSVDWEPLSLEMTVELNNPTTLAARRHKTLVSALLDQGDAIIASGQQVKAKLALPKTTAPRPEPQPTKTTPQRTAMPGAEAIAAGPSPASATQAAKEPWQMRKVEYVGRLPAGSRTMKNLFLSEQTHKVMVEQALSEGRPVPPEVLADYPDLVPTAAKVAPAATVSAEPATVRTEALTPTEPTVAPRDASPSAPTAALPSVRYGNNITPGIQAVIAQAYQKLPPALRDMMHPDAVRSIRLSKNVPEGEGGKYDQIGKAILFEDAAAASDLSIGVHEWAHAAIYHNLFQPSNLDFLEHYIRSRYPAKVAEESIATMRGGSGTREWGYFAHEDITNDLTTFILEPDKLRQARPDTYNLFAQHFAPESTPTTAAVAAEPTTPVDAVDETPVEAATTAVAPEAPTPAQPGAPTPPVPPRPTTTNGPGSTPPPPPAATGATPPTGPRERAGNILLEKHPEDIRDVLAYTHDEQPVVMEEARRGVRPDALVKADAEALEGMVGSKMKKWKAGDIWNAETILAARLALEKAQRETLQLQRAIVGGDNSTEALVRFRLALERASDMQLAVQGVTAELGRGLRQFRQAIPGTLDADALERALADPATATTGGKGPRPVRDPSSSEVLGRVLEQLGGREWTEKLVKELGQLDVDNPIAVANFIRNLHKPGLWDWALEIRYNGMLSGAATQVVNSISNAATAMSAPIERGLAATVEAPLALAQRRPRQRFFHEVPAETVGLVRGIPEGVRRALFIIRHGYGYEDLTRTELSHPEAFKGAMGHVVNLMGSRWMRAADALFRSINYSGAYNAEAYRLARREGLKGQALAERMADLLTNPTPELMQRSADTAAYRVYQQKGGVATQALMDARNKFKYAGIPLGKLAIPFVQTPVNLMKYGLERSPLGILNPDLTRAVRRGDPAASDMLGRWVAGMAIAAPLAIYAWQGKITGRAPTDRNERDRFYREGKQPYSLKLGDKWYSYQRLEPFNQTFAQVAALVDAFEKTGEAPTTLVADVGLTIARNLFSQNYMQGIGDALDAWEDPDRYLGRYVERLATSFLPAGSGLRTVVRMTDPVIREPKGMGEALEANVPGLSENVPAKMNVFGQEAKRETPWWSPYAVSTAKSNRVDEELARLGIEVGGVTDTIGKVKLSREQGVAYRQQAGQLTETGLKVLILSQYYREADDEAKARAIRYVTAKTHDLARENVAATLPGGDRAGQKQRFTAAELRLRSLDYLSAWLQYQTIPKYAGMTAKEAEVADQHARKVRALARERNVPEKAALAYYSRIDPEGTELAYRVMRQGTNPKRTAFRKAHPELTGYIDEDLAERALTMPAVPSPEVLQQFAAGVR